MTKIDQIQNQILEKMAETLSNEQLQKLENVMAIEFHGIEVQEECTQLVTSELRWQKILNTFLASKRIENCSLGTLDRYKECVTKLITSLNKRLQDITTNDIRYYLAMYQETRKISISYMDTIRRYLSSFFAWISDEGYITSILCGVLRKSRYHRRLRNLLHRQSASICVALHGARGISQSWSFYTVQQPELVKWYGWIGEILIGTETRLSSTERRARKRGKCISQMNAHII